ncbi:MAG: cyclic nucleotide-binding domain-containing protein [Calditerrivibrio sp.]|nr:cyclic nucleotide-binding domain-containing protein [Calditerrivibrio sp.]
MTNEKIFSILRTEPKFLDLTNDELTALISYCQLEVFPKVSTIIKEGEFGNKFYFIIEGEIGISKSISDEIIFFISSLRKGDFFGEMAIITEYPRSANAFAKTDVTLLSMTRDSLIRFKNDYPLAFGKFSYILAKTLADRLYKVEERIKNIIKASVISAIT